MELALSLEAADKNAKSVNGYDSAVKKLHFKGRQPAPPQQPCSRCVKSNHSAKECKFKDAKCHSCGKKGHIAPACRSKLHKKFQESHHPVNCHTNIVLQEDQQSDHEEFYMLNLNKFTSPTTKPI